VHAGAAELEYYGERGWGDRNDRLEMGIYIPVKLKEQGRKA